MVGFNVGINISLGDMEMGLDYLQDTEIYKEEIEEVKQKRLNSVGIISSENTAVSSYNSGITFEEETEELESDDNYSEAEEEEEDLDFGDAEDEETNEDFDFGDNDEDELDFGDEDEMDFGEYEEYTEETDEESEDDDFDFGDEEEEEEKPAVKPSVKTPQKVETPKVEAPSSREVNSKSERELELERQLAEYRKAEERRKEEERQRELRELAEARKKQQELERQLAEAQKLLKEREANESSKQGNKSGVGGSNNRNSSTAMGGNTGVQVRDKQRSGLVEQKQASNKPVQQVNKTVQQSKPVAKSIDYSTLEIDALWIEVRKFMLANGVSTKPLSRSLVEEKFGAPNIKKLILKSYLIPFGSKLTIGK